MKLISWNVNGLRACMNKGFLDTFHELNADFFCLQETKLQAGQIELELPGYQQYWCYAEKKGYSGTAIFTKHQPQSVSYGLGIPELDTEGRLITLEYPHFYLVTCYTPNAQRGLARIDHRLKWEEAFRTYLVDLDGKKPVILCGDLNVAHQEIDLKNPGSNRGNAGFSDEERSAFTQLLDSGFTDSFRHLYPDKTGAYSWWSYMFNARANNAGWRIDYFVVSDRLKEAIHNATIHPEYLGSDHCPVGLELDISCNGTDQPSKSDHSTEPEYNKSGAVSHAGPIIKAMLSAALVLAIGCTGCSAPQPPADVMPSETTSGSLSDSFDNSSNDSSQQSLVKDVIDRSGTIETITLGNPKPTDSCIQEAFTNGEETWPLASVTMSPFIPNNFHIQLCFDLRAGYTDQYKPEVAYSVVGGADNDYVNHIYYYDNEGAIAGCFLYGHTEQPRQIIVTVADLHPSSSSWTDPITQELTVSTAGEPDGSKRPR